MDGILFYTFGYILVGFLIFGGFIELSVKYFENKRTINLFFKILILFYTLYIYINFKNSQNDWHFFEKITFCDEIEVRFNNEFINHSEIKKQFIEQLKFGKFRVINKEIVKQDTLTIKVNNQLFTFKLWTKVENEMMIHLYGPHGFIKTYRNDKLIETIRWLKDSKEE